MLSRLAAFFRRIRLSSVNVGVPGVGGVSVGLGESERKIIRDLLVFLEGRRVLRLSIADEERGLVVRSVIEIREELMRTIQRLPESSTAIESLRQLRRACEEFLTLYARDAHWTLGFYTGLGRLRGLFGSELERLSGITGLKLSPELTEVGPPKTDLPEDVGLEQLTPQWLPADYEPRRLGGEGLEGLLRRAWEDERRTGQRR